MKESENSAGGAMPEAIYDTQAEALEAKLKAQYGWVRKVEIYEDAEADAEVKVDAEGEVKPLVVLAVLYFKRPSRAAMSSMARFAATNITKAAEIVFADALVHGDPELLKDDEIFYSLLPISRELTEGCAVQVKKL